MNRKYIAFIVLLSFFSLNTLTPAQAFWPFGTDYSSKDLRFHTVYPKSFWDSATWTVLKYTAIVVVVGGITYFTAGTGTAASAGIISTFIGSTIGSWVYGLAGGAAINAGLALLGGGAVAAGGFGILGGISVINAVGSLALTAAIDAVRSQIPAGTHAKSISLIKPRLFWDNVSPVVKKEMKELKIALDEIAKGGNEALAGRVTELLNTIDFKLSNETNTKTDDYTAYNYLFLAIIRYNMNNFDDARSAVFYARRYTDDEKSSVLDYVDAMLAFQAGDDRKAIDLLRGIIEEEPEAATPYIVLGQNAFDEKRYHEAFDIIDRGIKVSNGEVCVLNWMAGNSLYHAGRYKAAIPYYREALRNMTINEYEALYKLCIAKCYRKMNDNKNGQYWLDDAISEVKDNDDMTAELRRQYENE